MRKAMVPMLLLAIAVLAAAPVQAQVGGTAITRLRAFNEVPALNTAGGGFFEATINEDGSELAWELRYFNMKGNVLQAHLHFGQMGVNGGIVVFLCSNLGNGPFGTQTCPSDNGTVSGTIRAIDITGAAAQGVPQGDLGAVLRGIRAGVVYANVHTDLFPGGEIRGQVNFTPAD